MKEYENCSNATLMFGRRVDIHMKVYTHDKGRDKFRPI